MHIAPDHWRHAFAGLLVILLTLLPAHEVMTAKTVEGELAARPHMPHAARSAAPPGRQTLDDRGERGTLLYVPVSYDEKVATPLVVMLHGAGGQASDSLRLLQRAADAHGFLLLAPSSLDSTWDIIRERRYGPDVRAIDNALATVFARYNVDADRIAAAGFSDGASYALSLGVMNGALFTHVLAFSPGFMAPLRSRGEPRIFISHGERDAVLPINRCSRQLVPQLKRAQYAVTYVEFADGHVVPDHILEQSLEWFGL